MDTEPKDQVHVPTPGRQVRPTALGRGTHAVTDVQRMIEDQFHVAFPHRVWVAGEVGLVLRQDGNEPDLRFTLHPSTEPGAEQVPYALPCVVPGWSSDALAALLHRSYDAVVDEVLREGRLARVGGLLRFDPVRHAAVLLVSELDPTPTEAALADARTAARAAPASASTGMPPSRAMRERPSTSKARTSPPWLSTSRPPSSWASWRPVPSRSASSPGPPSSTRRTSAAAGRLPADLRHQFGADNLAVGIENDDRAGQHPLERAVGHGHARVGTEAAAEAGGSA